MTAASFPAGSVLAVFNRLATAVSVMAATAHVCARLHWTPMLLHPRPDVDPDFLPSEEVMTEDRRRAFEAARDVQYGHLLGRVQGCGAGPLQQRRGRVREVVAAAARSARMVVAGAAGRRGHFEARDAIEAVLFDADAPLLLVPQEPPGSLGKHVVVAWETSQAAEEAVEAALPLLLLAEQVTILVAEESHARAGLPDGIVGALRLRGPGAVIRRFGLAGRDIGSAILAEAHGTGADLLVMGAFSHRKALEAIFGGATHTVLAGADLPVLLHH